MCNSEAMKEELEEKRKAQVFIIIDDVHLAQIILKQCVYYYIVMHLGYLQVVAKLHAILRPFLLRRMKIDVEQILPRKKEIILYANMTENQRSFQDHLINKTLEGHLIESVGIIGNGLSFARISLH